MKRITLALAVLFICGTCYVPSLVFAEPEPPATPSVEREQDVDAAAAEAGEQEANVVEERRYVDAEGNIILVWVLADGSISVSINGSSMVTGEQAKQLLAQHRVTIDRKSDKKSEEQGKDATSTPAASTRRSSFVARPANIAPGSVSSPAFSTFSFSQQQAPQSNLTERPISR